MANQNSATAGDEKQADHGTSQNGNGNKTVTHEQELASYLQERITTGLNRGSIPLLARSLAEEIAQRRLDEDADAAGEPSDEEDEDVRGEADDEDDSSGSLEDEMRDLQASLGDDWILRVSLQGEDAWLTAEKDDGSQHVEAAAADVLAEVVELLNERGGRG